MGILQHCCSSLWCKFTPEGINFSQNGLSQNETNLTVRHLSILNTYICEDAKCFLLILLGKLQTQLVSGEDNHRLKKPFPYPWKILILELNINAIFVSHLLTLSFLSLGSGQNNFLGSYFPIFVVKLLIICDSWQLGRFLGSGIIFLSFFCLSKC